MRTTANITVRSHGFTVTDFNDDFYRAMCGYAATLVDHKLESIMVNGKRVLVKKPDRVFAASNESRKEMRFHINCLDAFKNHMQSKGWHPGRFKMIQEMPGFGVDAKFEFITPDIGPNSDAQKEWIDYQLTPDPSGISTKINNARTGMGKATSVNTMLKTPDGWVRNGAVSVGDDLQMPDGSVWPVTGVYPQGMKQVYSLFFEDGRKAPECCIEHLWTVHNGDGNLITVKTEQLMELLSKGTYYLPLVKPDKHWANMDCLWKDQDMAEAESFQEEAWAAGCVASMEYDDAEDLWVVSVKGGNKVPGLKIECIQDMGYEVEMQCIMIDHPDHLYIIDSYVVTHNTFMAIYQMVKLGKRTVITISPKYLQTWLDGIAKFVRLNPKDICVVRGSDEVNGLMKQAKNDTLEAKIIIISLQTYQYFMGEYEDNNGKMVHYNHTPDEFWQILNPGFLIVDEGHESIHALFKYDLYLNIRSKLICTATLEADSPFINEMYRLIYPMKWRFKQGTYDKYIESVGVMYGLKSSKQIKYKGFGGTYSHVKLEQSILKKDHFIVDYMRFINSLVDFFYIKVMKPGMKLLIYCATVDMCVVVTDYLERFYRAQGLTVAKYTQEDPTSALYDNDIVVSTLKSAGTGVDIPGLRTVIMTVAVGSMQINIQSLGRLRELKMFPGVTPSFVYTCCTDIAPHMQYHRKKLQIFADKTLSQRTMNSGFSL